MADREFELCQEHLDLLSSGNCTFDSSCETGSAGFECKRPFGNSYVVGDIAELLGIKPDDEEEGFTSDEESGLLAWYYELPDAMNIIFTLRTFKLGVYQATGSWPTVWKRKKKK